MKDNNMRIYEIYDNKKEYIKLLLLGDEDENMINKYIDRGRMFVVDDNGVIAQCVVTEEGGGIIEIKNIAVLKEYQMRGYGKILIEFVEKEYANRGSVLQVGTGESPLTIPFYKKCGFEFSHVVKNFFTDNYEKPIYENGIKLVDMIYLKKKI